MNNARSKRKPGPVRVLRTEQRLLSKRTLMRGEGKGLLVHALRSGCGSGQRGGALLALPLALLQPGPSPHSGSHFHAWWFVWCLWWCVWSADDVCRCPGAASVAGDASC